MNVICPFMCLCFFHSFCFCSNSLARWLLVRSSELRCLLQGFSFFGLNTVLTLSSSFTSLSISHTEKIVSFNATVSATVARNRVSKLMTLGNILVDSVEDVISFLLSLSSRLANHWILLSSAEEFFTVSF